MILLAAAFALLLLLPFALQAQLPLTSLMEDCINPGGSRVEICATDKSGHNSRIEMNLETIWEGPTELYPWPVGMDDLNLAVVSDSTNDTAAGIGARQVSVTCNSPTTAILVSETIMMNGLTEVPLNIDCARVHEVRVINAGSSESNTGNISALAFGGGTVYGFILADSGITQQAIYTCPADKCVLAYMGIAASDEAQVNIRIRELGGAWHDELKVDHRAAPLDFRPPISMIKLGRGADVEVQGLSLLGGPIEMGAILQFYEFTVP